MRPRRLRKPFYFFLLFGLLVVFYVAQWTVFLLTPIVPDTKPAVSIVIASGTSAKAFANDLHRLGLLSKPGYFVWLLRFYGVTRRIQAGRYLIQPGSTPLDLLKKLDAGDVVLHGFTIVNGWTFEDMKQALDAAFDLTHNTRALTRNALMERLNVPGEHPEGRFYPDTYLFAEKTSDLAILKKAFRTMTFHLNQEWEQRDNLIPYRSPYEALIVASLIEKETAIDRERPIISGVIERRLKKRMYLQIDASVIYGLGAQFDGNLTKKDLRKDTPYNLYVHKGLPPTPIAMPSLASLKAALHPAPGNELYYVAKGDGSHVFSETLKEHNKAVKTFILQGSH